MISIDEVDHSPVQGPLPLQKVYSFDQCATWTWDNGSSLSRKTPVFSVNYYWGGQVRVQVCWNLSILEMPRDFDAETFAESFCSLSSERWCFLAFFRCSGSVPSKADWRLETILPSTLTDPSFYLALSMSWEGRTVFWGNGVVWSEPFAPLVPRRRMSLASQPRGVVKPWHFSCQLSVA